MKTFLHINLFCIASLQFVAAQSTYILDNDQVSWPSSIRTGGDIVVQYVLDSGPVVTGLGSQFSVTYTVSDLISYSGKNLQYDIGSTKDGGSFGYIGLEAMDSSFFFNNNANLPANNKKSLGSYTTFANPSLFMEYHIDQDNVDWLGYLTVTPEDIAAPSGYQIIDEEVVYQNNGNLVNSSADNNIVHQGYYSRPQGSDSTDQMLTGKTHGETVTYDFTAFDNPNSTLTADMSRMFTTGGYITFDVVPEPSSSLLITAGSALLILRRKRK